MKAPYDDLNFVRELSKYKWCRANLTVIKKILLPDWSVYGKISVKSRKIGKRNIQKRNTQKKKKKGYETEKNLNMESDQPEIKVIAPLHEIPPPSSPTGVNYDQQISFGTASEVFHSLSLAGNLHNYGDPEGATKKVDYDHEISFGTASEVFHSLHNLQSNDGYAEIVLQLQRTFAVYLSSQLLDSYCKVFSLMIGFPKVEL